MENKNPRTLCTSRLRLTEMKTMFNFTSKYLGKIGNIPSAVCSLSLKFPDRHRIQFTM